MVKFMGLFAGAECGHELLGWPQYTRTDARVAVPELVLSLSEAPWTQTAHREELGRLPCLWVRWCLVAPGLAPAPIHV